MSTYYTILTNLGAALHANAQVMQTTVPWTHMCLGDGGGAPVVPVQTQTALKREVYRLPITDIAQHPDNPNWLIVEAVVPSDVGGWTVRETAIYGGANGAQCIAVGNYPETYKPVLAEGASREMVMRMVVEISSTATVKLSIDPAVAIASRAWVESLVATPQKRGLVKLATVDEAKEGVRPDVAVTPEGLDAAFEARVLGGYMFEIKPWTGSLEAMPKGFFPLSGVPVTEMEVPGIIKAIADTGQPSCTIAERSDPLNAGKWGIGVGHVLTPDWNGVSANSIGGLFFGGDLGGSRRGTVSLDQMRNLVGALYPRPSGGATSGTVGGADEKLFKLQIGGGTAGASSISPSGAGAYSDVLKFDASNFLPPGTTANPVTGETHPKATYGTWMIRLYGSITNVGSLDAAALVASVNSLKARVEALEAFMARVPGVDQKWVDKTSSRAFGVIFTNGPVEIDISVMGQSTVAGAVFQFLLYVDEDLASAANSYAVAANTGNNLNYTIPAYARYRVHNNTNTALARWKEKVKL